ncbi:MAG TPA: transglycosylase domain-containing protein [Pseudogracilibacillus sp.]|nr:transglycosylase domain-containing protein [Pseudogracilibacillus sp.]
MRLFRLIQKLCFYAIVVACFSLSVILAISYYLGPPETFIERETTFYDQDEEEIEVFQRRKRHVELDHISPFFIDAIIAVEDRHFYDHHGFDYRGIARAVVKNVHSKRLKEGASTITQQYARNLYLSHEKTWIRKLKEAFYTVRLEMFYDKESILTGYLNTIYFGHGAYGIEDASFTFFNKRAKDLTLAEAAMLAGIPKGPTYYSPFNDEESARERQMYILQTMLDRGIISQAQYYEAKQEKLQFAKPQTLTNEEAPHYIDVVIAEAADILQIEESELLTGGYKVFTKLDPSTQEAIEQKSESALKHNDKIEMAAVAMEPDDGAIVALVGGRNYANSTYNRATNAKRMVGSIFKPILYYAALERGFTPSTKLKSEPTKFALEDGELYEPSNYNGYYAYKPISLAQALALSDNVYAVKTNLFLQPENVVKAAKKFGITSDLPAVPSLALGSASISLLEMTTAYGMIANGGKNVQSYTIEKIENSNGKVLYTKKVPSDQRLNEQKTFILTHLMQGMFDRRLNGYMDVTGAPIADQLRFPYAGKSGTTDTDSWMVGFSPKLAVGVWIGYDDNEPLQTSIEKTVAKTIWAEAMEKFHEDETDVTFPVPNGIVKKIVDVETGLLATSDCAVTKAMYFEAGTEPTTPCTHDNDLDENVDEPEEEDHFLKRLFQLF